MGAENLTGVMTEDEDLKADEVAKKKLAEAFSKAFGNGACTVPGCECHGFISRISNPTECKHRGCRHGLGEHL